MTNLASRVNRLTAMWPTPRCAGCGDHSTRIVFIDGRTDEVVNESMPEEGCPECGRAPYREIHVVGDGWQDLASLI